jgi:hypothetical protein
MGTRVYAGASARSRREYLVYCCPCGERFRAEVWRGVDSGDADAVTRLCEGRLNQVRCPSCGQASDVQVAVVFHDTQTPRLILVLPDAMRHRELEERARFFDALAADAQPPQLYVLETEVAFGAAGLRALLAPSPSEESFNARPETPAPAPVAAAQQPPHAQQAPHSPHAQQPSQPHPQPQQTPQPRRSPDETTHPRIADPELVRLARDASQTIAMVTHDSDEHTRVRMNVPDPRAAMIERWIAGREGPSALLVEDSVMVCAALPPAALESFIDPSEPIELRVQLHRLPSYPVLALTVVAPMRVNVPQKDDSRVLTVPLDIARAAHRVVLDALARKTALKIELYDSEYLPVISHQVSAPLEENVRRLVGDARDALDRLAPGTRSFERARGMLFHSSYDRLGRTQVELPDEQHEALQTPGAVLQALATVSRWSEPSAEAYLVEIRSLPLTRWRTVRARIIHRALDIGIAVSRPLVERSAKEYASPLPSWQELLAIQVRRFAEVSARVVPNNLSAAEEAENWELLLRECSLAGVIVDDTVRQLAAAALKRARAGGGGGVDLRAMESSELVALLEQKELRREAAVVLCERREAPSLPAVFSAIRRMPRGEANMVLPAVTRFGMHAEKWLIDGLKSKKSFMRQGCALALGTLHSPLGVDALVRLLLFEPTEIWSEVARALGDVGAQAVMPLAAKLREVDPERRDRIVQALAHVAARMNGARAPIEMLASGRDVLVAQAAQRALALTAEVKASDEAVRRGKSAEQTVVRGFSRRFYEALDGGPLSHSPGSGAIELDPGELEEIDEESDLLTATDIPALRPVAPSAGQPEENTSPTPRSSLPRSGG